jgi:hypothetical protein
MATPRSGTKSLNASSWELVVSVAAFFLLLGIYIIGAEVRVGVATALAEPCARNNRDQPAPALRGTPPT